MGYSDGSNFLKSNSKTLYVDGSGINANNQKIVNLKNPTSSKDAVTLGYTETNYLNKGGGIMTGDLNMNSNKISGLPTPVADSEAVTLSYMSNEIAINISFIKMNEIIKNSVCAYKIEREA